jgi:dTDP-4-dehydrorhamnose 3,5-epimerase
MKKYNLSTLITPSDIPKKMVNGVVFRKLVVNQDDRGNLVEVLKTSWADIYNSRDLPFTQVYHSTTKPGVARDIDCWHFHPGGQMDRYSVIFGDVVVAVYDIRYNSATKDTLNLFALGERFVAEGQAILLVPPKTLHGFVVVGKKPATLLNFPSKLYDPEEEWRLPFSQYPLPDGSTFSWKKVIKEWNKNYLVKSKKI